MCCALVGQKESRVAPRLLRFATRQSFSCMAFGLALPLLSSWLCPLSSHGGDPSEVMALWVGGRIQVEPSVSQQTLDRLRAHAHIRRDLLAGVSVLFLLHCELRSPHAISPRRLIRHHLLICRVDGAGRCGLPDRRRQRRGGQLAEPVQFSQRGSSTLQITDLGTGDPPVIQSGLKHSVKELMVQGPNFRSTSHMTITTAV